MTELVRYDTAKRALAEAKAVDEVKSIRDKAMAMRLYAQQAKDKTLEADAVEIRLRAERRVGEMIQQQKETVGLAKGGGANQHGEFEVRVSAEPAPTLKEAGIDKGLAHRARSAAAIPEGLFEYKIAEVREAILEGGRKLPEFRAPTVKMERTLRVEPVVVDATTFDSFTRKMEADLSTLYARQTDPFSEKDRKQLISWAEDLIVRVLERKFP